MHSVEQYFWSFLSFSYNFWILFQVLSMLVAQSAMSRAGGSPGGGGKPCLAVSHIRDQLIPPQDRRRKDPTWQKVCKYIR